MDTESTLSWLEGSEVRRTILSQLTQPMTARQLCRRTGVLLDRGCRALWELAVYMLVSCLNVSARRGRVYWLTDAGTECQRMLREHGGLRPVEHVFPEVDWHLYGWVCFRHRTTIIRALVSPMYPAEIKRKALSQDPELRISTNNVRDVIRLFLARGIVAPVRIRGRTHPRYELTDLGSKLQILLNQAEVRQ
ncbi:MAG: hypothetical protein KAS72_11090 [Phycisphaerales bacterium]|nr:hypothetical protein [Phycisphaerales bacterium]